MVNRLNTSIRNEIASVVPLLKTLEIPRVDPIAAEQQARYRSEGLSYISNNESIIPRDAAGNITMQEGSTTNPLLIIDPVTEQITVKSALKILDTNFQYYKFPATIRPISNIEDLVVDLDFESDTIAARYTIPAELDPQGQPVTYQRIATSFRSNWFTNGGDDYQGTSRLPFVGGQQAEIGSYTITPEILETLRAKNKTLKFSIQVQFTSIDQNNAVAFKMILGRNMPEVWRSSGTLYQLRSESNGKYGVNEYPFFKFDYVVDIFNDAAPYDQYFIDVSAGAGSWVLTPNCYWKIDVIDIPTTPSLNGDIGTGVYSINESGDLILSEINEKTFFDPEVQMVVTRVIPTDIYEKINGQLISLTSRTIVDTASIINSSQLISMPSQTTDPSAITSSNPTGNVSEDIDETYPPFGAVGSVDGETRPYLQNGIQIATFRWDADNQYWEEVES